MNGFTRLIIVVAVFALTLIVGFIPFLSGGKEKKDPMKKYLKKIYLNSKIRKNLLSSPSQIILIIQ